MQKFVPVFFALTAGARFASAQLVTFGALGGVPFLDASATHGNPLNHDESRSYFIGPSVEFRLPANFAIEADGIYRRLGNSFSYQLTEISSISSTSSSVELRTRGNVWQIPVLGKYYFRPRDSAWRPFVASGWAFRGAWLRQDGHEAFTDSAGNSQSFVIHDRFTSDLQAGATFAAGLRYRVGRVNLLPQIRYTRWGGSANILNRNEAGVFLGATF